MAYNGGGSTPVIGELINDPMMQNALIDYIANTPSNFNANLFKEFLTNPYAQSALRSNYLKKITPSQEIPSLDDSDIPVSPIENPVA